jgi:hypothetical protein
VYSLHDYVFVPSLRSLGSGVVQQCCARAEFAPAAGASPGSSETGNPVPMTTTTIVKTACAYRVYPVEVSEATMCCPSNATFRTYMGDTYCTNISKVGQRGWDNSISESGVCSAGTCLAQRLGNGDPCSDIEDEDCLNGVCGAGPYPTDLWLCLP